MKEKSKIIIFCQSPRDLAKVISLYEEFKDQDIEILVINVYSNYKFLNSLSLNAKIQYIPHKKIKNPFNFLSMLFILKLKVIPNIKKQKDAKVYFFSQYFDYVTAILLII